MNYSTTPIPWRLKMAAKLALSRLPVGHRVWKALHVFELGHMDNPRYAHDMMSAHLRRAFAQDRPTDYTVLELGPGESVSSALVAYALGARASWLVDTGAWATAAAPVYQRLAQHLRAQGLALPALSGAPGREEVLAATGGQYLTAGLESLASVPNASVDLVFSQAVLEHVRSDIFLATQRELRRVLRPGGVASHRVDLKDHLSGGLNHLRFSAAWWDGPHVAGSGFYTNRIRLSAMLDLFAESGFTIRDLSVDRWPQLPLARQAMAAPFRSLPDKELLVSGFNVVLAPTPEAPAGPQ